MLTQSQCENEIMRLVERMDELTNELARLAEEAAEAEAVHKVSYAQSFLRAEGSITQREQEAIIRTHTLFKDRKIKEALYASCKQSLSTLDTAINALRTIAANIRGLT